MSLLDELRGISPLEPDLMNGAALSLLECQGGVAPRRVVQVICDGPDTDIVVLWVNHHDEARTSFLGPADGEGITVHTRQGFV